MASMRQVVDPDIQVVWPEFQLRYTDPITGAPGSATGIRMLLAGQLAFSQSSRSLKSEDYEIAQRKGYTLKQVPVALDGIAIAVNHKLPVSGLTVAQIKDIYTSKITNWKELGGPDLAIVPYSRRPEEGGTVEFFQQEVLEKADFGDSVEYVRDTTEGLQEVSSNEGGIYYASAPQIVPQCSIKPLPIESGGKFVPPYQLPFISPSACSNNQRNTNPPCLPAALINGAGAALCRGLAIP